MKLTITINMNNAAFEAGHEVECARILTKYADSLVNDRQLYVGGSATLHDINGNVVGTAKITK